MSRYQPRLCIQLISAIAMITWLLLPPQSFSQSAHKSMPEVRGTWITTTANDAIATPQKTAETMRRLADIGINTVYVETWKNGYTQFPSAVLQRVIGVSQRPQNAPQDPSDVIPLPPRDLLSETLIEAHRNGLIYVAWFEYGFMAAHQSTMNHLRRMKPEWLSRDVNGSEIAKNGFVWMNPLHPEARALLLDIVLEAIDKYDLDGIQLDDRIVWPHITMGYDDYTKKVYAAEHGGAALPIDHNDAAWMRWRAEKVNEFSRWIVQEVRAKRPGLIISLSPAVYPWSWENYLLDWPAWAKWTAASAVADSPFRHVDARHTAPRWDEFVPQAYRTTYAAFEKTWLEQVDAFQAAAPTRNADLVAGIRLVGEGKDSDWPQLRDSIMLTRVKGNGGHVHWFSRGVLDVFPNELKSFYAATGRAHHPLFPSSWRRPTVAGRIVSTTSESRKWQFHPTEGDYRVIARESGSWRELHAVTIKNSKRERNRTTYRFSTSHEVDAVEMLSDRRNEMRAIPACRVKQNCR
jgi:uncharacterized lipoprotein YddW (UPF0748 family)